MLFNRQEVESGSKVHYESSKLQYASTKTKLDFVTLLTDRGLLTINQGLITLNLPPIDGDEGDKRFIRREYVEVSKLGKEDENKDE